MQSAQDKWDAKAEVMRGHSPAPGCQAARRSTGLGHQTRLLTHQGGGGRGSVALGGEQTSVGKIPRRGLFLLAFMIREDPLPEALSSFYPILWLLPCLQPRPTSWTASCLPGPSHLTPPPQHPPQTLVPRKHSLSPSLQTAVHCSESPKLQNVSGSILGGRSRGQCNNSTTAQSSKLNSHTVPPGPQLDLHHLI